MATAASIIPADATPFVQGFPSASTRIIYGQWVYPDNTGIVDPPTIEYVGAPYYLLAAGATLFTKKITATMATAVDDSTRGVWFAEVLVYDDPDIVGDVAVKISHALVPNGITLAIPKGDGTPLNIANALPVVGSTGGLLVVTVGGGGGSTTPADGTVTDAKITSGRALVGSTAALELIQDIIGSTLVGGTYDDAGGTYSLPVGGSGTPGANSITSAMLIDGTVGTSDLADGSITDAKIAVGRALLGSSAAAEYVQDIVGAMSSGWTYDDPSGTITLPSAGATPAIADAVHMLASSLTDFTSGASTATKIAAITANDAAIAAALVSAGGKRVVIPPCPTNTRGWPASVVIDEQVGTYTNAGGTQTTFAAGLHYAISGPLRTVPGSLAANGDPQDSTHLQSGPALTITRKAGNVFVPVNLRNNFQLGPNNPSSGSVFTVVCTGFELSSGYSAHAADELISLVSKNNYGTSQRAGYGDGTAGSGVYKGTYLMVAGICINLNSLSYTAMNTAIGGGSSLSSVERRVVTNNAGTVTALVQGDIAGAPQIVVNSMSGDFVVGENVRDQATNAILGTFASATLFTYGTLDTVYDDTPQMRVVPRSSVDLTGLVVDTDGDVDQVISSWNRPDAVYLCGVNNLNTGGMRIKAGYAAGLVLRSAWDFYGDVHVAGLANHAIETAAAERAYGYGVRFLGHCQNGALRAFTRRIRHAVTNNEIRGTWNLNSRTGSSSGSVDLCTNFWNHGQGLSDAVIMGDAHEMLGTAWDMHEGMWNVVFLGVTVRNGNSAARSTTSHDGITLRGGNITVIDPDFRGVRIGVNDQSGPLDFDGRTSTNRIIGGVIEAQLYAWAMTEDVYKEELNRYRLDGVTLRADPNVPSSSVMGQSGMFIRRGNVVDRNCVFEGFNDRAVRHTSYVDTTSAYALGSNATGHATHINPFFDWSDADASRIYSQEATWASIRVSVADALVNPVSGTQKPLAWFTQQSGNSNIFYRGLTGHPLTGTAVPALNNVGGGGTGSPTYTAIAALGDAAGGSSATLPIYLSIDNDVTTMPTAGTTVSDLAALQTNVPVGSYDLDALLLTSYNVTGGGALRFGVGGAGAAGASVGGLFGDQGTSATARNMAILTVLSSSGATGVTTVGSANTFGNSPGTAAVTLPQTIKGKLTVTTAGVLGIIWQLSNGATAAPTLKAGSYLKLTKVA